MRTNIRSGISEQTCLMLVPLAGSAFPDAAPANPALNKTTPDGAVPDDLVYDDDATYDDTVYEAAPRGWTDMGGQFAGNDMLDGAGDALGSWTTVVALSSADAGASNSAMVSRVAELAVHDELAVVYAHAEPVPGRMNIYAFVAALRVALPRHNIVSVLLDSKPGRQLTEYSLLRQLLEEGAVSVAAVSVADPAPAAAELAERLPADRVIRLSYDPASGVFQQVLWTRQGLSASEAA